MLVMTTLFSIHLFVTGRRSLYKGQAGYDQLTGDLICVSFYNVMLHPEARLLVSLAAHKPRGSALYIHCILGHLT